MLSMRCRIRQLCAETPKIRRDGVSRIVEPCKPLKPAGKKSSCQNSKPGNFNDQNLPIAPGKGDIASCSGCFGVLLRRYGDRPQDILFIFVIFNL
jgi:hypothetical protein